MNQKSSKDKNQERKSKSSSKDKSEKEGKKELLEKIKSLELENKQWQDKFLRTFADLQNIKKRMLSERQEIAKNAALSIILDIFKIIDNFDLAFSHVPSVIAQDNWFTGIKNTKKEFDNFLTKQNIKVFAKVGDSFHPDLHEALLSEAGEKDKIIRVIERGITLDKKVVRIAKVSVGNGQTKNE